MAWESRQRGGRYYTRTRQIDGSQIRGYCGAGLFGELAAAEDAARRQERERERQKWREEKTRITEREGPLCALEQVCDALMKTTLETAGYHQHRNEWRKRRGGNGSHCPTSH